MTQNFGCTVALETQAHSWLRNCFSGATVQLKGKSDSGIIESSFLSVPIQEPHRSYYFIQVAPYKYPLFSRG